MQISDQDDPCHRDASELQGTKLKVGHKLLGIVKKVNDFDIVVSLPNHLTGFVSLESVSQNFAQRLEAAASSFEPKDVPVLKESFKVGQFVICCIKDVQVKPKKRIELTLNPQDVNGKSLEEFTLGTVLQGEVLSLEDRGYKIGFGVEGEAVGFLPINEVEGALQTGQSLPVAIKSVPKGNSRLVQVTARIEIVTLLKEGASIGSFRPGCLVNAEVTGCGEDHVKVKFAGVEGRIDLFQLPDGIALKRTKDLDLSEAFPNGRKFKCRIVWADLEEKKFLLSGKDEIVQGSVSEKPDEIDVGVTIDECSVIRVDQAHGVVMEIPGSPIPAYVHISQLSDEHLEKTGPSFKVGTRHSCRVVDYDPFDGILQGCTKHSVLKEPFIKMEEVKPGQIVKGSIARVESYGVLVQLTEHIRAICPIAQLTETQSTEAVSKYKIGNKYRFRVVDVDPKTRRITLTRKTGLLESDLPALTSIAQVRVGEHYDGYIAAIKDFGMIVRFYNGVKGLMPVAEISDEFVERPQGGFFLGQVVRCRATKACAEKGELNLSLRKSSGPKQKSEKSERPKKEAVTEKSVKEEMIEKRKEQLAGEKRKSFEEIVSEVAVPAKKAKTFETNELTLDDLVEDDPEIKESVVVERKNNSKAQVGLPNLREICDEFEKRLIGQPNSSLLWIQYMSALLKASELEQARAIAERALATIRFRDEQEKLNVWIAFLNLENAFGTEESLKKVFERAIVYNDPKTVFLQLVKIYEQSSRPSDTNEDKALELHKNICKKFSQSCKVWVGHMLYLYTAKKDSTGARRLLPQALRSLPKRKHIKITCKAAQLEYKYGDLERARTLFEGVLSNAPKRVDIWSVYLTMEENRLSKLEEASTADRDFCRRLFERIVHLKVSSKKAKFFFKKFLDFEKANGTPAGVEHVKELARAYVESTSR